LNSLSELASKYNIDKKFDNHNYMPMYERWLGNLHVNKMLEIGFGSGGSARMWLEYFPDAEIYIMELAGEEFQQVWKNPNTDIPDLNMIIGNSLSKETWDLVPNGLDFLIDDGDHKPENQIVTFELGFPKLREHGIYVIEDCHCGFELKYGGKPTLYQYFFDLVMDQQLPEYGTEGDFYKYRQFMTGISREIYSYHFYKSVILIEKA
jgi:hypothetical protein